MMKKRWLPLLLVLILATSSCGVEKHNETPPAPTAYIPENIPVQTPTMREDDEISKNQSVNPLTGKPIGEEWVNRRPIAIMLNNLKAALPQLGQSQCDIIYECLAEGGITRMMGVYQSVEGVGMIGSVRSSRPYYLELALGHDAVYLHAGGSPDAYNKIKAWNVTALDCVNGPYEGKNPGDNIFWRDKDRRKNNGLEHSVVTTGDTIIQKFSSYSFRQEHEAGYQYAMAFSNDGTPENGMVATVLKVPFSSYKTGVFTYDPLTKRYLVEEYGKPYVDGNSGEQVGVTNVIVIQTACYTIRGDSYGRVTVDLSSGGTGYFACGGKVINIHWSKNGRNGQLIYTGTDGQPITLGVGSSYVNVAPLEAKIIFE